MLFGARLFKEAAAPVFKRRGKVRGTTNQYALKSDSKGGLDKSELAREETVTDGKLIFCVRTRFDI